MVLPVASVQTWIAATEGRYGEDAVEQLAPHVRPDTAVLDISASLGLFTVPATLAA